MSDLTAGKDQERKRGKDGRFLPGKSGNPAGRKKGEYDIRLLLGPIIPSTVEKVTLWLEDPVVPVATKVRIVELIWERYFGKAPQAVELTQDSGGFVITINGGEDYAV